MQMLGFDRLILIGFYVHSIVKGYNLVSLTSTLKFGSVLG